jgi:putative restriction endonuclease
VKAVFDAKAGSRYDDEVASRYHFPKRRYLETVASCLGDWIVYREPRDSGGSMGYFATARVDEVVDDPRDGSHAYALLSAYLPFDAQVPFRTGGTYEEEPLRSLARRSGVGASLQGRSVRPLADADFASIILKGFSETLAPRNAARLGLTPAELELAAEATRAGEPALQARRVVQLLVNRPVRDASFRHAVLAAYDDTCAVTRLRIVNGGGRAEAQAAHIVPVAKGGPDVVQNGIALCGTAHWLFDRHLISVGEDMRLLVAHNQLPEDLRRTFLPEHGRLHLPSDRRLWPGAEYLGRHREAFAGAH